MVAKGEWDGINRIGARSRVWCVVCGGVVGDVVVCGVGVWCEVGGV